AIAAELDRFCRDELGGAVRRGLFHSASIGAVTAVELVDGRRVVVKAHQPERELEWLQEVVRVQMHLASRALHATTVCGGPSPIGRGLGIVEAFVERGATRDAHEPIVRAALARGLREIVVACAGLVAGSSLRAHLGDLPAGALWPTPHSKLFDFSRPAAWIDEVARAARARMQPAGALVIGHGDWRAEHVRFEGDRIVGAFDWDSLCKEREPALVGYTAHAFCADWSRTPPAAAPTLDEARAFVAEYEAARGRPFTVDERRLCGAAFAYSCAYTARCGWGLDRDERGTPGTFQHLVASHGPMLMEL
ncbi:MAG: phosphotransferase, partial [Polyangia bacterium]